MDIALVAAVFSIVGVLVGQWLPERFARNRAIRDQYDAAIRAVAEEQAARHGIAVDFPAEWVRAEADAAAHIEILRDVSTEAVTRFLNSAATARASLAALHPYSPDLKPHWNKFQREPAEMDHILAVLYERRKNPLKRHAAASA